MRLRGSRVSLAQLLVISAVSAIVSALIVVSALGETAPQRAVTAALRTAQVIHVAAPPAPPRAPATALAGARPSARVTNHIDSSGAGSSGASGAGSSSGNASSIPSSANVSAPSPTSTTSATSTTSSSSTSSAPASKVKHLFVIALSTPSYAAAFGRGSLAKYLNAKLRPRGELLTEYRTLGAAALPDLIAMVSGQAPNKDTTAGCATYSDFRTGVAPAADGLVPGRGCVYPNTALTIGDQLDGAALPWRAYMEGMSAPCVHPNSGAPDGNVTGDYATARNPFVYFHSLLDLGDCQRDDLPYSKAAGALQAPSRTPSYAFISPGPCDSGAATTCVAGQPNGIAAADAFLKRAVPAILNSAAYRASGALLIVFTATPSSSTTSSSTTTPSPTTAPAATATASGPVRTGALVLSPFIRAGSTDAAAYGPYSVLRTAEDVFSLSKLARAASAHGFDTTAFSHF